MSICSASARRGRQLVWPGVQDQDACTWGQDWAEGHAKTKARMCTLRRRLRRIEICLLLSCKRSGASSPMPLGNQASVSRWQATSLAPTYFGIVCLDAGAAAQPSRADPPSASPSDCHDSQQRSSTNGSKNRCPRCSIPTTKSIRYHV